MIEIIVLIFALFLILLVIIVVGRAVIKRQQIIGKPPVPVFFFVLAKTLVLINLAFLLLKGLRIETPVIFEPVLANDLIALAFLITGIIILLLSTVQLNKDLIFGLYSSGEHHLQTGGIYALSRHPFYLGFIFILFSSCLLTPNYLNIAAFLGAWLIHHFIMIKEEQFLTLQYGEEYRQYSRKVNRYITLNFILP
jgi:protein-S-isoprenylcysteine O-methyltransferase Ste14